MELKKIVELLNGKIVVGNSNNSIEIKSVCSTELMSDVLHFASRGAMLVTGLNQSQAVRTAEIADIPAVLISLGKKIDNEMADLAKNNNIMLISTPMPSFTVCGILYAAGLRSCLEK